VDYLGVAFADEGISLKNGGIHLPIMVLNLRILVLAIIQYQLEPEIYCLKGLLLFLAKEKNLYHFPIHIKLDTGMHRAFLRMIQWMS
jgi:alanine racemase